jgi:amidohydrolase
MNKYDLEKIINLRHQLHKHPEASNNEFNTKKMLIDFLTNNTSLQIVDKGKWFYAVYLHGDKSEKIAFRADFDAILMDEFLELDYGSVNEGIAHKCGHDGHSAILAALAIEVEKIQPNKDVFFVFQHAEETGEGAFECKEVINEHNIDEIYAFHNTSGIAKKSVMIKDGLMNFASKGMIIELIGIPTHASQPENGINPAVAFSKIIEKIDNLSNSNKYKGLVLATIIQIDVGQEAFGIAASEGKLLLTIRAEYESELNELEREICEFVKRISLDEKLECKISFKDEFPSTVNHKQSVEKVINVCNDLGLKVKNMSQGMRGSEDFGYFLKETKGALFYVGNGINYPPLHTKEYDCNEEIIETVLDIFLSLINYKGI